MRGLSGAELSVVPSPQLRIALRTGAHVGVVDGSSMAIPDGYSPFADRIRLTRVEIAASFCKLAAATAEARKPR
jgi:hypothetical protein